MRRCGSVRFWLWSFRWVARCQRLLRAGQTTPSSWASSFGKVFSRPNIFSNGVQFLKVGNSCQCRQDCWLQNVPLKTAYDDLFKMVRDPERVVAEFWVEGEWYVEFRRSLSVREFERWKELQGELYNISLEIDTPEFKKDWQGLEKKKGHLSFFLCTLVVGILGHRPFCT